MTDAAASAALPPNGLVALVPELPAELLDISFRRSPLPAGLTRLHDGVIVDVNDAYLRHTGYQRAEVIGRTADDLGLWARAEDHAHINRHWLSAAASMRPSLTSASGRARCAVPWRPSRSSICASGPVKLRLGLLFLMGVAVLASAAGKRAQARLVADYPPPGQLVDVGGDRLHLHCQGEGSPAVIFDAGAGFAPGLALAHLQRAAAEHTTGCTFDRAGQGWSDPSPRPRTAEVMVEELHLLLQRAGVPAPYVLAGWSFGGLTARLLAYQHPDEVAGLVLMDARHERQLEVLGGRPSPLIAQRAPGDRRRGPPARWRCCG
jgi:hypothetical protein